MRQLVRRISYALRRRRIEADLAEELAFHQAMRQQDFEARGMTPADAALAARRAIGNTALARNDARDVWIWPWLQDVSQDVRFGARILAKDRRFTFAAVVALGLGMAVNNSVFMMINTAMIRDLPFDEPRALVAVQTVDRDGREGGISYLDFEELKGAGHPFAGLAASASSSVGTMNVSEEGRPPERFRGSYISASAFDLLRSKPLIGRSFLAEDDRAGAPAVLMLGYGVWQSRYGGDPAVVGRSVRVNDVPSTVIGVMPRGFAFPFTAEMWQPLSLLPDLAAARRDARTLTVFGRLATAADLAGARADFDRIAARLARDHPDTNKDIRLTVKPLRETYAGFAAPALMTLMGAVGFVLLIACANVANLLLARAAHRSREIAIRASLGATRRRIVRQLLIECVLLAAVAGTLGLLLSMFGVRLIAVGFDTMEVGAPDRTATPYWVDLSVNGATYAFLGAMCLFATLAFGLIPALQISRIDVNHMLKDGGRSGGGVRATRWAGALMIAELALTCVLLAGAGLLWRNFLAHYRADLVIDASNLVTMRIALPATRYGTADRRHQFLARLEDRLAGVSAFSSVAIGSDIPLVTLGGSRRQLAIDGRAPVPGETPPMVSGVSMGRRYFETAGIPLAKGWADPEGAIVNQRFAAMFFPNDDPVGHRIRLTRPNAAGAPTPWITITGVSQTLPQFGPPNSGRSDEPVAYVPFRADPAPPPFVSILARGELAAVTAAMREEVRALDPNLPLYSIQTVEQAVARTRWPNRVIGTWFGLLAVIALALASVGLFAVTAHGVAERTQEIGVRMALGAQTSDVVWLFVRRTVLHLAVGLTLGLGGTLMVGQLLTIFLARTSPRDPVALTAVLILVIVVSLTACVLPARRAARVDPVVALRYE
jgi:putative ABC transport system permease protein